MMNIKIDINVCRVCLQTGSGISLFDTNAYADQFQYSTQLKVSQSDGLPDSLCNKCVRRLKIAYSFRKQSEVSDQHLRSFIDEVNKKFSKVTTTHVSPKNEKNSNSNDADLLAILENDEQQSNELNENENFGGTSEPESILPTVEELNNETEIKIKLEKIQPDTEDDTTNSENDDYQKEITKKSHEIVETYEEYHADYEIAENEVQFSVEALGFPNNDDEEQEPETPNEIRLFIANDDGDESIVEGNFEEEHLLDNIYNNDDDTEEVKLPKKQIKSLKTNTNQHFCNKCNKDFSTKTNLVRHMSTHDGNRPFKCEICDNRFTQNGSLKQHMFIHTGTRPYVCEYCDRGFTQGKSLVFHMRRHTGEKPFECKECGLNFRQRDGLKRHESVKHAGNVARAVFPCEICKKFLSSKYSLSLHVRKHMENGKNNTTIGSKRGPKKNQSVDVKIYECTQCPKKTFTQKSLYESHLKQHSKQTILFKCKRCSKTFANKTYLQAHIKSDHGYKKSINYIYECSKCKEKFTVQQQLLEHLKLHENTDVEMVENEEYTLNETTGESSSNVIGDGSPNTEIDYTNDELPTYKCNECDLTFDGENSFKQHRNNEHDDEDNDLHECDECGFQFPTAFDLDAHILADHDELEEVKCNQCDENFTSLKLFEEHKMMHELNKI